MRAVRPSATLSGPSGSRSASSRTRRQCASACAGADVPAHTAARACHRAASSSSPAASQCSASSPARSSSASGLGLRERAGDRGVHGGPALAELRAVRDLLGQRVLEGVHGLGVELALVARAPPATSRPQRILELARRRDRRPAAAAARRTPCRSPRPSAARPSRARPSRSMRAASDGLDASPGPRRRRPARRAGRRRARPPGARPRRATARPPRRRTGCRRCARAIELGEAVQRRVAAEQVAQQRARSPPRRSGASAICAVVRLRHPGGAVLGAEVDDQQVRGPGSASTGWSRKTSLAGSSQCRSSTRVTPGSRRLSARERAAGQREELPLPRLGVHRGGGSLGVGHAEEVEEQRQVLARSAWSSSSSRPAIFSRAVRSASRSSIPK